MNGRKKAWFEGWYFKQQKGAHTLALIPAYHIDQQGNGSCSIQVITHAQSYFIRFPAEAFWMREDRFLLRVGENVFSERGVKLNIHTDTLDLEGQLFYGPLTPLSSDIMGPFRFVPNMQCRHGVISMKHPVHGRVVLNGEAMDFQGGQGYLETDRGRSFPQTYLWTQCNQFSIPCCSIMAAAAEIPLGPVRFSGVICAVVHQNKEYRFATYNGTKILFQDERNLVLSKPPFLFSATLMQANPQKLRFPQAGAMDGVLHESAACTVRYQLYQSSLPVFDCTSTQASFERKTEAGADA